MPDLPPRGTRGTEIPKPLRMLMKSMSWGGELMFRMGAKVQGLPLLRLTTIGAKTGKRRKAILGWFPDETRSDSYLVVASGAGSPRHPGWAFNLAANPMAATADIREGEIPVIAELLTGIEREGVWDRVVELAPGYVKYLDKTDREIPIFRLTPSG